MGWKVAARRAGAGAVAVAAATASLVAASGGQDHHVRRSAKVIEPDALLGNIARGRSNTAGSSGLDGSATSASDFQVAIRAQPRSYVDDATVLRERSAARALPRALTKADFNGKGPRRNAQAFKLAASWQSLGPVVGNVAPFWATMLGFSGQQQTASGRVTALAVSPTCGDGVHGCEVWVGAAGGGVWRTRDALAPNVAWESVSDGLPSNAIGSLVLDPTDPTHQTLYAGTGEGNESSDSEAGLGLYRSTDSGSTWTLVPGSFAVAKDRAINAIAIDPTSPNHIYVGTGVGRHQSSAYRGGTSVTAPPGAPPLGLYESTDGGKTFSLAFSRPSDTTPPISARGAINEIALDPSDPQTVYVSVGSWGIWRRSPRLDGDNSFHQVFAPTGTPPSNPSLLYDDRTTFALTTVAGHTRMYVGDGWDVYTTSLADASFFRVNNVDVPAGSLTDGTSKNPGWTDLTNPTNGTPGFATKDYCFEQCSYDNVIAVDPKHPSTVWFGGQTQYNEIQGVEPFRSNGRAVMRSTDGGVNWTDMTADDESPQFDLHPDQHAIAFDPANPNIVLIGNDGGVYRTDGQYVDDSNSCDSRPFGFTITGADLAECKRWLSAIPHRLISLNPGLDDLQFQSLTFNPANPTGDLLAGTQDNGTWNYTRTTSWTEIIAGDGGSSGFDAANPAISYASFTHGTPNVNFHSNDPLQWDVSFQPLIASGENSGFYNPLTADPVVGGTVFVGLQHVWRSIDSGGRQSVLDQHCGFAFGDFTTTCGDYQPLGIDLTAGPGRTGPGDLVAAIARTRSDTSTVWAATRYGRVYVSHNADASDPTRVTFMRVDTPSTPTRYPTDIVIDPADANHAWVSFTGYNAFTPSTPGHVFDVSYDPRTGSATWTDISSNIGDQPVTNLAYDDRTGDLYAATDFVVMRLPANATRWEQAAPGLPLVATYGLTIAPQARALYAATHGRGVYELTLP